MLKSWLTVEAILRRADRAGIMAVIVQRGDGDAGAILVRFFDGAHRTEVRTPMMVTLDGGRDWHPPRDGLTDPATAEDFLQRRMAQDPDCWVLDIWSGRIDALLVATS
jgi:hypothetical protein